MMEPSCTECPLVADRRTFLQRIAGALGGTLVALSLPADVAQALSRAAEQATSIRPIARAGETVTYPMPSKDAVQIDSEHKVIVARSLNKIFAFSLTCPHQNTALTWHEKEDRFICPKHHSEYAADGDFVEGRATRGMDRYAIKRQDNTVVVDLAVLNKQSDAPEAWTAACVVVS